MTTKAEFNAEEWDAIARAPALAGLIVIASQRGGTIRESLAMAKSLQGGAAGRTAPATCSATSSSRPTEPRRAGVLEQGGHAHNRAHQDHRGR